MTEPAPLFVIGRTRTVRWLAPPHARGEAFDPWREPPIPAPGPMKGKAIIVCCDGTGNHPKQTEGALPAATNVYLLYDALTEDSQFGTRQVTWYDPGVGTGTSREAAKAAWITRLLRKFVSVLPDGLTEYVDKVLRLFESATGAWIEENIEEGYREIARNYEVGDRIFIFGFSRGAYTARCIAGVISRCGLLKPENLRFTPEVISIYRRRRSGAVYRLLQDRFIHPREDVKIHVLGLWDTVASLGLPLWGWWFRVGEFWRNKNLDTNPADICEHVYHAMSMDERRSQFFPTVTTPGQRSFQRIRQYWLRGAHADVGGGYGNRSLGDIGLEWMLQIAHHHGLRIRRDRDFIKFHPRNGLPICGKADPMGKMHDELKSVPGWNVFGSWPRWAPVYRPYWTDRFQRACAIQFGAPHDLVYRRAERAAALWAQRAAAQQTPPYLDLHMARDGLKFLDVGEHVRVRIAANQVWNRTSVVMESAALYRVSYASGAWHDQEKPACGPAGQPPSGLDLARRLFFRTKRMLHEDWLTLAGHIAAPRHWPVAEFGFFTLMKILFWREPRPLTRSLIPFGRHLRSAHDAVYILNVGHNGLFHAFGNDAWGAYANNSGAVDLVVERIAEVPRPGPNEAAPPFYAVTPRGDVVGPAEVPVELVEMVEERSRRLAGQLQRWPSGREETIESDDTLLSADGDPADAFADRAVAFPDALADAADFAPRPDREDADARAGIVEIDNHIADLLAGLEPIEQEAPAAAAPEPADQPLEPEPEEQRYEFESDAEKPRNAWSSDWGRGEV